MYFESNYFSFYLQSNQKPLDIFELKVNFSNIDMQGKLSGKPSTILLSSINRNITRDMKQLNFEINSITSDRNSIKHVSYSSATICGIIFITILTLTCIWKVKNTLKIRNINKQIKHMNRDDD